MLGFVLAKLEREGWGGFSARDAEFSHVNGRGAFQLISRWLGWVSLKLGVAWRGRLFCSIADAFAVATYGRAGFLARPKAADSEQKTHAGFDVGIVA